MTVRSRRGQRGVEGLAQGRVAERLEQACHGTLLDEARDVRLIRVAIMKTIGTSCRRCSSPRWRSGPLMPGMGMSRSRQAVVARRPDARNSRPITVPSPDHAGDGKCKRSARTVICFRPYLAAMALDYGTADGQADAHAVALGGEECVEKPVDGLRIKAHA